MVDEETDADLVPMVILTEREGAPDQIGTPLAQRVVEAFHMRRLAGFLPDGTVPFGRKDFGVGLPEITGAHGAFAIVRWERAPELAGRAGGSIPEGHPNDSPRLSFQGDPNPDRIVLVCHKGPELIQFKNRAFGQGADRLGNWCQDFFLRIAATVMRLSPVVRAIARCDSRSRCSFSTVARCWLRV